MSTALCQRNHAGHFGRFGDPEMGVQKRVSVTIGRRRWLGWWRTHRGQPRGSGREVDRGIGGMSGLPKKLYAEEVGDSISLRIRWAFREGIRPTKIARSYKIGGPLRQKKGRPKPPQFRICRRLLAAGNRLDPQVQDSEVLVVDLPEEIEVTRVALANTSEGIE